MTNPPRWRNLRGPALNAALLAEPWYARPDDTIGGWCITAVDLPPSAGYPTVGDFLSRDIAEHIVALHNARLAVQRWTPVAGLRNDRSYDEPPPDSQDPA